MGNQTKKRNLHGSKQDESKYEVEEIKSVTWDVVSGFSYLVKWAGFSKKLNSWKTRGLENNEVLLDYLNQMEFKHSDELLAFRNKELEDKSMEVSRMMSQRKCITMHEIASFDPFEFKVYNAFYCLFKEDPRYIKILKRLVLQNYFFTIDQRQRQKHYQLITSIRAKEAISFYIENEEDFNDPPVFDYICHTIVSDSITKETPTTVDTTPGCSCQPCSRESECCAKGNAFLYKRNQKGETMLRHTNRTKIIECGDSCKCGSECLNRLTQQDCSVPLCLFKTLNRGWGIRARKAIPKNTFIFNYSGEMINQEEADRSSVTTYFFDVSDQDDCYVVDSATKGNLSRFVNHSCSPNMSVLSVFECNGDPKKPKLR